MSEDRKLQRVITWRIENQRLEEMWLMEALRKEERLEDVRKKKDKFKDRVVEMDWNTVVVDEVMEMEWMEFEQKEHEELTRLMEQLELEFRGKMFLLR